MENAEDLFYNRQLILKDINNEGQINLKNANVTVVGAGGLGCPCLTYLTAMGIGKLTIIDFDKISISNLHRQTLFMYDDIGKNKAEVARDRLIQNNPFININALNEKIIEDNVVELLKNSDLVVDATDNFLVRYLINDACVYLDKPLVYGAVYQTEGHLSVFNYKGSPNLRDLFPENINNLSIPTCNEAGVYSIITGIIGVLMANEVIKIVLKKSHILSGKLLNFNALNLNKTIISYHEKQKNNQIKYSFLNKTFPLEISCSDFYPLIGRKDIQLIDVREDFEREICSIGGIHIPLRQIQNNFSQFEKEKTIVLYCHYGMRSANAALLLRKNGFENAYSLKGGIHRWAMEIDTSIETY